MRDMGKYIIDIEVKKVNNAGFKLRRDFNCFASNSNYESLKIWFPRFENFLINLLFINIYSVLLFVKYLFFFEKGSMLLIQYPLSFKYINSFLWIRKIRTIRVGILINDLDSLRHKSNIKKEFKLLQKLDYIISPNRSMSSYLSSNDVNVPLIDMKMYDYKIDIEQNKFEERGFSGNKAIVVFAGNLKKNKSGFIYSLSEVAGQNFSFHLYGDNYHSESITTDKVKHMGTFAPGKIDKLTGDYGLVWDGPDTNTCSGNYGTYLKLNNPHKTSLYLTAGLPVITWDKSAISEFIILNNIGICVGSLIELSEALGRITRDEYQQMKNNALDISSKLKQGYYLGNAIKASEALFPHQMP